MVSKLQFLSHKMWHSSYLFNNIQHHFLGDYLGFVVYIYESVHNSSLWNWLLLCYYTETLVGMHLKIGACVPPPHIPSWRPPASVATSSTAGYTCANPPPILYRKLFSYCTIIHIWNWKYSHTSHCQIVRTIVCVLRAVRECWVLFMHLNSHLWECVC